MAKKLQGITIEIDGNTTKLSDSLKNVNKTIYETSSELKQVEKLLKLDPGNTELLRQKQELLSNAIKDTTEKLNQLKIAKEQADKDGNVDKSSKEYRELEREIAATEQQLKNYGETTDDVSKKTSIFGDVLKANLASEAIKKGISALADGIKTVANALIDVGKESVKAFAEYEQLVGGIDTIFKDSSDKVQQYAENAYMTAGISANQYMEQATSFSASLLQSLSGDTEKAADVADMAIRDMSDNANKMGTDISSLQTAYQGFAKQNYTMLDNLKLGYGGTKTEMERLLADAEKFSGIHYDISSLNDVYQAIHVVQEEMGITGTTALEAGTTIQGSFSSMKSAWQNLLTGLGNSNANIKQLVSNLVTTIVGDGSETNRGLLGNIMPVVETIIKQVPAALISLIPELVPIIGDLIIEIINALLDNAPAIIDTIIVLFDSVIDILTDPDMIAKLIEVAVILVVKFAAALVSAIPKIVGRIPEILKAVKDGFVNGISNINWKELGKNILDGILDGLLNFGNSIRNAAKTVFNSIKDNIKSFFGIHSPAKKMQPLGKNILLGVTTGLEDEVPKAVNQVEDAMKALNTGIQASVNPTINPVANSNPLIIQIDNFNNTREQDIQALAEELEFYRKNSALARGGN